MADVFISYAREDRARADQIARGLQAMGLECFWDTEIPPGQTWADYIEGKLGACKAVIVLWSAHSTGSQWVREEARMGRDKGKLIPAMLDNSPAPFGFGEVQAANLSNWNGQTNHPDWVRFANAVDQVARGPNAQPRPVPPPHPQPSFAAALSAAPAEENTPIGYIKKCLRLYFDGKGRARRSEFAWFLVFQAAVAIAVFVIDSTLFGFNPYTNAPNSYLATWLLLGLIAPAVSVGSRRFHDLGLTGWLAALTVIPYLGFIVALIIVFIPGKPGDNQYGPNPKGE